MVLKKEKEPPKLKPKSRQKQKPGLTGYILMEWGCAQNVLKFSIAYNCFVRNKNEANFIEDMKT